MVTNVCQISWFGGAEAIVVATRNAGTPICRTYCLPLSSQFQNSKYPPYSLWVHSSVASHSDRSSWLISHPCQLCLLSCGVPMPHSICLPSQPACHQILRVWGPNVARIESSPYSRRVTTNWRSTVFSRSLCFSPPTSTSACGLPPPSSCCLSMILSPNII